MNAVTNPPSCMTAATPSLPFWNALAPKPEDRRRSATIRSVVQAGRLQGEMARAAGECRHRRTEPGRRRRRSGQWRALPFVCGASCFLTGRSLEQIKADIAYSNANVKLIGISSGMAYGELGPDHHSIEDFAWTRVLPNLPVIAPAIRSDRRRRWNGPPAMTGPAFLRLSRVGVPTCCPPGINSCWARPMSARRRCGDADRQWHADASHGQGRRTAGRRGYSGARC